MKRWSLAAPIRVHGVVLIPIRRVRIESWPQFGGACIFVRAEPRAIVVQQGGRWRALGLDGAEVSLDSLLSKVPGLANAIGDESVLE